MTASSGFHLLLNPLLDVSLTVFDDSADPEGSRSFITPPPIAKGCDGDSDFLGNLFGAQ